MDIPYYILLILYLVGLFIFFVWTFFNVWHLVKFGFFDFTGKLNAIIFLIFTIIIVALTFVMLQQVPWLDTFNLFSLPGQLINVDFNNNNPGF